MVKNKLYRIDKWLSKGNRVFLVLLLIGLSVTMIHFTSTMFIGFGLIIFISLWLVFVKTSILSGRLKFDKSYYILPIIGEKIVIQKDFKYDSNKVENDRNYIYEKSIITLEKGFNFEVLEIKELKDDWVIKLKCNEWNVEVYYLDIKGLFKTITDIRDDKLKRILE